MEREKFVRSKSHKNIGSVGAAQTKVKPTTVSALERNLRRDTALLSYLLMDVDDLIDCDLDAMLKEAEQGQDSKDSSESKPFTMRPKTNGKSTRH